MKILQSVILPVLTAIFLLSCQKELKYDDNGLSTGTFKKDAGGNCLPVTVTGVFQKDSTLTSALFVDIQVNVTFPGTFDIRTDTVNGYSFSKAGSVVLGTNTIRLYPSGKPLVAGTDVFTVKYGLGNAAGVSSTCSFAITVVGPAPPAAVFTLAGSPGTCTGVTIGGTYTALTPLTASNTITITVDVAVAGTYAIGAATTNGFLFTGTGLFTSIGPQNVTLTGTGTPLTAGTSTLTITTPALNTCTYGITVLPGGGGGGGAAVFSFDGGSGTCTSFLVAGVYTANTPVTAANTVTLNVTVVTPGTYTITTNTVNNFYFTKSGSFAAPGNFTVVLNAAGTPNASGNATFYAAGTSTCSFTVNVVAGTIPANTDYFPLTNTSWWSYDYTGMATPADTLYSNIYGAASYNSTSYKEMKDSYGGVPNDTAHYRKSINDYFQWATQDYYSAYVTFDSPPVYTDFNFLRENATAGTTWNVPSTGAFTGTTDATGTPFDPCSLKYIFTIAETNTSVTVNSVTYTNVIHVKVAVQFTIPSISLTNGVTENDDYYYAKGIGLVKLLYTPTVLTGGGAPFEVDLKNYKVN